jgi:iron-sulfur cluster protein
MSTSSTTSPESQRRESSRIASPQIESPRAVANKTRKHALLAAIRMALRVESPAVRHNTQTFNRGRYAAVRAIPDYAALKDQARAIKEDAIARLPELIATLEKSVQRNGGHFYLAADAHDASEYIAGVCKRSRVKLVVKGKSMTSEEIHLNPALEALGIEVAETDLAEFILQYADEQPSHIIGPAIHYSRERITELFRRVFKTDEPLDTGEELTAFARKRLRDKFLRADAGITGANFVVADSGTLVLVESEANIRMTSLVPPLHIAISGIEKIVPTRESLAPFIELLAASATGQLMSSYVSVIQPPMRKVRVVSDGPAPPREFHLVMVDNGRMKMREDPMLREALRCIRCSACLNVCANFQTVGGHAFGGETYSGGIGGAWEAGTKSLLNARFSELCTGCLRCVPQCPVQIDIPWLNTVLRQRINGADASPAAQLFTPALTGTPDADAGASLQKLFFGRYDAMAKWASKAPRLANAISNLGWNRSLMEKLVGLDHRRALPPFASPTLVEAAQKRQPQNNHSPAHGARAKAVLFADVFTNYGPPARGLATLRVLETLGVEVIVSEVSADGRAAFSQGLIATAAQQAKRTAASLAKYIQDGRDIVVVEPSVLAMFRLDYRHLLDGVDAPELLETLRLRCFDSAEYVWHILRRDQLDAAAIFPAVDYPRGTRLFYHSHCQQKSIGADAPTLALLQAAGFDVATSRVECCGMAGSFGYKKDFYDLSMAVGRDLFNQVRDAESQGPRVLVATGTSCQEQLHAGLQKPVFHPMEVLAESAPRVRKFPRRQ